MIRLAAQLSQHWNLSLWASVSRLLIEGDPSGPIQREARPPRQIQRHLPAERWDQIIDEYQAGASANSLANKYGVDCQTVLRRLASRGIKSRPSPLPTLSGSRLEEALAMRGAGLTYAEIGRHFGISRTAVSKALNGQASSVSRPLLGGS